MTAVPESQRFGPAGRFELQPLERRLLVSGAPATLGARAFDLLLALAGQPGVLLTKHALMEQVWPGAVVEEGNLATQISSLRKVLGGEVIATIPGRGYRFAAPLEASGPAAAPVAAPPAAVETPPAPLAPPRPALQSHLPDTLPPLFGRADDLAALDALGRAHRLLSVVGAGGVGKTRLAQAFLHGRRNTCPHGVCWVELAPIADAAALPAAIASALGVPIGDGDPLLGLCGALRPLALWIALDNAEHLLEATAGVAQALWDAAPGVRLLVTSQVPLKLPNEYVYRIGTLGVPPGPLPAEQALAFGAVALFAERARQADTRFALTDANAPPVIELCRQLDGVALAIELAAARAPMLGVQRLAASMQDRLKLLSSSRNRAAPARQQTLRAALEWSHGFLDDRERTVFRRLAIFAGSGSLTMVQNVVADPHADAEGALHEWAVLDALALLVDRSLVVAIAPDDATEPRYRLLDSPRLFALERLRDAAEEGELRRRHAVAFAERFDAAWDEPFTGHVGLEAWRDAMAPDLDNGRQAFEWARAAGERRLALRIAATLLQALTSSAQRESALAAAWCEPLLDGIDDPDLHARVAWRAAYVLQNDTLSRALAALQPALDGLSRRPATDRQRWLRHLLLVRASIVHARLEDRAAAAATLEAARRCEDAAWPPQRRVFVAGAASMVATLLGDPEEAIRLTRRCVTLAQASGDSGHFELTCLVDAELAAGDAAGAARTGTALLAALAGGRDQQALILARINLGAAWLALDDAAQARPVLCDGWAQAPVFRMCFWFADYLALLAALESRPRASARLAGYADAANAAVGPRQSNEAAAIERAARLARAALGDADFDRLHAEGTQLRDADGGAIAFGSGDA